MHRRYHESNRDAREQQAVVQGAAWLPADRVAPTSDGHALSMLFGETLCSLARLPQCHLHALATADCSLALRRLRHHRVGDHGRHRRARPPHQLSTKKTKSVGPARSGNITRVHDTPPLTLLLWIRKVLLTAAQPPLGPLWPS